MKQRTCLILVVYLLATVTSSATVDARQGVIYMSDGTSHKGKISLYPGRKFHVVTWAGDQTANLGRTEAVAEKYGKMREFGLDVVKEIRFMPRPPVEDRTLAGERMDRKWDWAERGGKSNEKIYIGKPFPVRELQATFLLNSGETLTGTLQTMALYLQEEEAFTAKKFVIRSKQKGAEGQLMKDLHYINRVVLLDEGKQFVAKQYVTFAAPSLESIDEVRALTRDGLTPVSVTRCDERPNTVEITGSFGEGVLIAVRKADKHYAGWPGTGDPDTFKLAKKFVMQQRDYYNEKKLLGVHRIKGTPDVWTLVSLRRRVPPNALPLTGERDPVTGEFMEFFRLSIWRWRHDTSNDEMVMISRGTFFRKRLKTTDDTPHAAIAPRLWIDDGYAESITVGHEIGK